MPDYLVNVRVNWDQAGTDAFIRNVVTRAEAAGARRGAYPPGAFEPLDIDALRTRAIQQATRNFAYANDPALIQPLGAADVQQRLARAQRELARITEAANAPGGREAYEGAQAQAAVARRVEASSIRSKVARELSVHDQYIKSEAEAIVANRRAVAARNRQAQVINAEAARLDPSLRGTRFQQLQAGIAARQGGAPRLPTEFLSLRQFITSRALTTAGFAVSGAAIYGTVRGISQMVSQAQELERVFNQIERQFESLGKSAEFEGFRRNILDIARETGIAADEVAFVGFQLQGAFGGDTQRAIRETEAAIKATRVTGLELNEVIDSFTALVSSYQDQNITIEQVNDRALGLQERFGVLAKETVKFSADLAPLGAELGFTVEQLESLGAVAQKYSGRPASALVEGFGRVLPAIQERAADIINIFRQVPDTQDLVAPLQAAFQSNDIQEALYVIGQGFERMDPSTRNVLLSLIGTRRETQYITGVLQNINDLTKEWDGSIDDAGRTQQYFNDLQETLEQRLKRLGAELTQLGVVLYEAGLDDILKEAASAADLLVSAIRILFDLFDDLNESTGGWLVTLLKIYGLMKLMSALGLGRLGAGAAINAASPVGVGTAMAGGVVPAGRAGGLRGVLGFGGWPLIAASAVGVASTYQAERGDVRDAADQLRERIKEFDIERVREIARHRDSWWTRVTQQAFGGTTNQEIGLDELRRRAADPLAGKVRALMDQNASVTASQLNAVLEEVLRSGGDLGGLLSGSELEAKRGYTGTQFEFSKEQIDAVVNNAIRLAKEGDNSGLQFLKIFYATIGLDPSNRKKLEDALAQYASETGQTEQEAKVSSGVILQSVETAKSRYEAGLTSLDDYIGTLRDLLKGYEGLSSPEAEKQKAQILATLTDLRQQQFQRRVRDAKSLDEVIRLLGEGPGISEALQEEIDTVNRQIAALERNRRSGIFGSFPRSAREFANQRRLQQARLRALELQRLAEEIQAEQNYDNARRAQELIHQRNLSLIDRSSAGVGTPEADASAAIRRAQENIRYAQTLPAEEREIALNQAYAEQAEALRQAEDVRTAIFEAQLALTVALLETNPVAAAQAQVRQADYAVQTARGEAARLQAEAEAVRARRNLAEVIFDVRRSEVELLIAISEAAGRTVEAAITSYNLELEELSFLYQTRPGDTAAINRQRAEVIRAQAAVRDADLEQRKADIQFALDMEQATTAQAIAQFEALLQIPNLTQEQTRDILRTIKRLRDELGRDLQFNLPGELRLPTLYEARRLNQSPGGYQDNRQVAVTMYINNGMDQAQAQQFLSDALGTNRFGTTTRRY